MCVHMCVGKGAGGEGQFLFMPQHPEQELIKGVPWWYSG